MINVGGVSTLLTGRAGDEGQQGAHTLWESPHSRRIWTGMILHQQLDMMSIIIYVSLSCLGEGGVIRQIRFLKLIQNMFAGYLERLLAWTSFSPTVLCAACPCTGHTYRNITGLFAPTNYLKNIEKKFVNVWDKVLNIIVYLNCLGDIRQNNKNQELHLSYENKRITFSLERNPWSVFARFG